MPYIRQLSDDEATGAARREIDAAYKRAGRVWNILRIMTPNGEVMRASMRLYAATMYGDSPLTRVQREMLATVTSAELSCVY